MAVAAGIAAGGSLLSGITGGKAAAKAAKIQAASQAAALAQQQSQFNTTQANFSPFIQAGASALGGQQTLLGLNGNDAQQSAITALQNSAAYQSEYGQGLDAINQNAAATGGLRGGNTALAQSTFGSNLLAQTIQQQLSGLGGLSSLGVNAASSAGGLGQSSSNAISSLLTQQGNTGASSALASGNIFGRTTNDLSSILQSALSSSGSSVGGAGLLSSVNGLTSGLLNNANSSFASSLTPGW